MISYDLFALRSALELCEGCGGEISDLGMVLRMGSPEAAGSLCKALTFGADRGFAGVGHSSQGQPKRYVAAGIPARSKMGAASTAPP